MKTIKVLFFATAACFLATACTTSAPADANTSNPTPGKNNSSSADIKSIYDAVEESGKYTTRESVAAYLCKFDKLPSNYVGKNEGQQLYETKTGKTFEKWNFNPWTTIGVMIGGDKFNNYASNANDYYASLPEGAYYEADVEYSAKNRGTKRLVYQSDCVIYYTADHYETFSKLEIQ